MFPIGQFEGTGRVISELKLNKNENKDNEFVLAKNNIKIFDKRINLESNLSQLDERLDLTKENSFMFKSWSFKNAPLLPLFQINKNKDGTSNLWIHTNSVAEIIDFNDKNLLSFFKDNFETIPLAKDWNNFIQQNILEQSEFKLKESNKAISLSLK